MDAARVNDLFVEILHEIKAGTKLLCRFSGAVGANRSCQIKVGHDAVLLELCPVGGPMVTHDRCSLLVKTPLTKAKRFSETKAGWFAVKNVTRHVFDALQVEQNQRQIQTHQRQLQSSARNAVQRLAAAGLPEGVTLLPSALGALGHLDVVVTGLPEPAVRQLLKTIEGFRTPTDQQSGLWAHLQSDDET